MSYRNRSMLGVTLLEIMLVLAIAGMIIVMSVRYYQSATDSSQANSVVQQIQAVIAAEETIVATAGAYAGGTDAALTDLLPRNGLVLPWGGNMGVTGGTSVGITLPGARAGICANVEAKLRTNGRISGTCTGGFTYQ